MARDIGCERRGKEDRGSGHVGRGAHPALGNGGKRTFKALRIGGCHLRQLGIDKAGSKAVDANAIGGECLPQRFREADRACLRSGIGRIADVGPEPRNRTDDHDRAPAFGKLRTKPHAAVHYAVEVDRHDLAPPVGRELAALVEHRPLREDQHIKRWERGGGSRDRFRRGDIDAGIAKAGKVRTFGAGIVLRRGAGSPDVNRSTALAKALRNAIADTA